MPTTDRRSAPPPQAVTLTINGSEHLLMLEPRRTLLDTLRNELHLTGTKKVCAAAGPAPR